MLALFFSCSPKRRFPPFFLSNSTPPLSSLCSAPPTLFSSFCNRGVRVDALDAAALEEQAMSARSIAQLRANDSAREKPKNDGPSSAFFVSSTSTTSSFFLIIIFSHTHIKKKIRSTTASAARAPARSSASPAPRAGPSSSSPPSSGRSTGPRRRTSATAPRAAARARTRAFLSECASAVFAFYDELIENKKGDADGEVVGRACDLVFSASSVLLSEWAERLLSRRDGEQNKSRKKKRQVFFDLRKIVDFCNLRLRTPRGVPYFLYF